MLFQQPLLIPEALAELFSTMDRTEFISGLGKLL